MQNKSLTFRARARTIEHLGKGQIADCPTAVSELWKNAYDAYARDVALYTIDGDYPCGALIDNGCGMSIEQLVDNWLIVGTESKSKKKPLNERDRFGLDIRKTQGEKGIGRLSAAFLSPVTYLVTKKIDTGFTALLIDWRLFENPYLSFEDITVPFAEFDSLDKLGQIQRSLVNELKSNVLFESNDDNSLLRKRAWERFSLDEFELSNSNNFITTQQKILNFCESNKINSDIYSPWEEILKKVEALDGKKHGTALFLLDLGRELSLLTNTGDLAKDNTELVDIEQNLVDTLRAFVNPYSEVDDSFSYEIFSINKNKYRRQILNQTDVFGNADFISLEHTVVGTIDEKGWFKGQIKAFGENKGDVIIPPNISVSESSGVGSFEIKIGTFEFEFMKTTHTEREHANLVEKAKKYSGMMIFRDQLRVLPYGRVDNDFFQIEERRSLNAGRHYWSNRRLFGYIGISQENNKELKDKSGREGFIRNQAARELKTIISDLLTALADKYFGSRSEVRIELLAQIKKEKELRQAAQQQARKATQKSFNEALKNQAPILDESLRKIISLKNELEADIKHDINSIRNIDLALSELDSLRTEIKTPTKPAKLGVYEEKYRDYRDKYNEFSAYVIQLKLIVNKLDSELNKLAPGQLAKKNLEKNQGIINSKLGKFLSVIEGKLSELSSSWNEKIKEDRSIYYQKTISLVEGVENGESVEQVLNALDSVYIELVDSLTFKYQSIIKGLEKLSEGINLESAFSLSEEERAYFEDKARSLNALAQLGISVEIMSHELEEMDSLVTRGLNSLPASAKEHPGFQLAYNAHKSLTQQIRFLSPLKISGYQSRQRITGRNIQDHLVKIFRDRFERQRVDIRFGSAFLKLAITDLPSRIYPVFTNIINNALYWVCLSDDRRIEIDLLDDLVIIANSGPAVDEDDIERLFELFYSKRANGHGVGLYLCRENLAVAHHKIWYSDIKNNEPYLIKNGANFIIKFNGLEK